MDFDVPAWLATLTGLAREDVEYRDETESEGFMSVTYTSDGKPLAKVNLVAVPLSDSRRVTWQVLAELPDRLERAQVPARTHFIWR
jgi:hypothetical protein